MEDAFDPIEAMEIVCTSLQSKLLSNRLILRLGTQALVFGNLLIFAGLYCTFSLPLMQKANSSIFAFVSSCALFGLTNFSLTVLLGGHVYHGRPCHILL